MLWKKKEVIAAVVEGLVAVEAKVRGAGQDEWVALKLLVQMVFVSARNAITKLTTKPENLVTIKNVRNVAQQCFENRYSSAFLGRELWVSQSREQME